MTFIHVSSTGHYSHDSVSTRPPAVALESLSHSSHWCSARLLTSLSSAPQLCSLKAQSSICKLCLSARLCLLQCHNRPRQRFRWRITERIHHLLVRHVSRTCERASPLWCARACARARGSTATEALQRLPELWVLPLEMRLR